MSKLNIATIIAACVRDEDAITAVFPMANTLTITGSSTWADKAEKVIDGTEVRITDLKFTEYLEEGADINTAFEAMILEVTHDGPWELHRNESMVQWINSNVLDETELMCDWEEQGMQGDGCAVFAVYKPSK